MFNKLNLNPCRVCEHTHERACQICPVAADKRSEPQPVVMKDERPKLINIGSGEDNYVTC